MGTLTSTCSRDPDKQTKQLQHLFERTEKEATILIRQHQLEESSHDILLRVLRAHQGHVFHTLKNISQHEEKMNFIESLNAISVQLVDSLVHSLLSNKNTSPVYIQSWSNVKTIDPQSADSQQLMDIGVEHLKNNKVAVVIMASGSHNRYGNCLLEMLPIDSLPSRRSLIEILLMRCQSIGQLLGVRLPVVVFLNPSKDPLARFIRHGQYPHIRLEIVEQYELGIVNSQGKLQLTAKDCIGKTPCGTGDILARLKEEGFLEQWQRDGVNYISIVPSNDILQPVIDCLQLGYSAKYDMQCLVKSYDGNIYKETTKIMKINGKLYTIDEQEFKRAQKYMIFKPEHQQAYYQSPGFTQGFIMNVKFLNSLWKREEWLSSQGRQYRVKQMLKPVFDLNSEHMIEQNVYFFEKQLTDVLNYAQKFDVVRIKGQDYGPVITEKQGGCSLQKAVQKLSTRNKLRLGLPTAKPQDICEIAEEVSVWGQNLEEIGQSLKQQQYLSYPLYIHQY